MNTSSNNPNFTLLRERVDDLQAYLAMWDSRSAATDKAAVRAAGSAAMERLSATATQLAGMSSRLLAELQAFDDGVAAAGDPLLNVPRDDRPDWIDSGSGPGYSGRVIPPIEDLHDSGDDEGAEG